VRELRAKRVWFAEPLLCSGAEEVRRLLRQARDWAAQLGLPVQLWLSDKQDAFVTGIAAEFPGVAHRYCSNHFLRDLAKPMLEADSHAKVRLRSKVRGLRTIEREILQQRRSAVVAAAEPAVAAAAEPAVAAAAEPAVAAAAEPAGVVAAAEPAGVAAVAEPAGVAAVANAPVVPTSANTVASVAEPLVDRSAVVLDYCSVVRGILNDDQGGPLEPPGLRMAEALGEVQASLQRNLAANLGGRAHAQLQRLAGCIARGLSAVQPEQTEVRRQRDEVQRVAATLDVKHGSAVERQTQFACLQAEFAVQATPFYVGMAALMASFAVGLFADADVLASLHDNLDLERWFRLPKGHERRIHGHRHAGVRLVQEGPTLMLALDAHLEHPGLFTADDLRPYQHATAPPCQDEAIHRRKVMRKARSKKNAPPC